MRIAVSSDLDEPVARFAVHELRRRGHQVSVYGALRDGERDGAGRADWAWSARAAAEEVSEGRADQAVVCCWTGTGASIAANKVPGVRAALCPDAYTADGARRWNDANVLAVGLRLTSQPLLTEILDSWFSGAPSTEEDDLANVAHLGESEEKAR